MKSEKHIKSSRAARCLLAAISAVPFVAAQCENKTGFAKRACEVASHIPQPASGANPSAASSKIEPLSTTLADAICLDALPANVEPKAFRPLTGLDRTDDGSFILKTTGIFEAYVQSYSLDPGERSPTRVAGFYPAPIKGRRANVIGDVLKQVELHPGGAAKRCAAIAVGHRRRGGPGENATAGATDGGKDSASRNARADSGVGRNKQR